MWRCPHCQISAPVGSARVSPGLFKQADPQMGHFLELALYRHQRRIRHLVIPILWTSGTYRRFDRGSRRPRHLASTLQLIQDIERKTYDKEDSKVGPCKHSAKQKAFVTVLAGPVFLSLRPEKAPCTSGGLFRAFRKSGRGGDGRGYI